MQMEDAQSKDLGAAFSSTLIGMVDGSEIPTSSDTTLNIYLHFHPHNPQQVLLRLSTASHPTAAKLAVTYSPIRASSPAPSRNLPVHFHSLLGGPGAVQVFVSPLHRHSGHSTGATAAVPVSITIGELSPSRLVRHSSQ